MPQCINPGQTKLLSSYIANCFSKKMAKLVHSLSSGWSFKDRDTDEWLPVATVPSVVQQDLIANNK